MTVFETRDHGREQSSYLMISAYKNFFVKMRYTYDKDLKDVAEASGGSAFRYVADQFIQ